MINPETPISTSTRARLSNRPGNGLLPGPFPAVVLSLILGLALSSAGAQLPGQAAPLTADPGPSLVEKSGAQAMPFAGTKIVAEVPEDEFQVGDAVTLTLTLPGGEWDQLDWKPTSDQKKEVRFDVIRQTSPTTFSAIVRPLREGMITVGPIALKAKQAGQTGPVDGYVEAIKIEVKKLPQADGKVGDFTPPLEAEYNYLYRNLIIGIGSLVAIALVGWIACLIYKRIRTAREIAARPIPKTPLEVAMSELSTLRQLTIFRERGPEAHYTALSMLLRRYLEDQIGVRAAEMTEDELQEVLRNDRKLRYLQRVEGLAPLLGRSSLAKFAKEPLSEQLATNDCSTASELSLIHI